MKSPPLLPRNFCLKVGTAAEIVLGLEKIASAHPDAALSVGILQGGEIENVLPDSAFLAGTLRTVTDDASRKILDEMHALCDRCDAGRETNSKLRIAREYPVTVNDPAAAEIVRRSAERTSGVTYEEMTHPKMTAEDFSFYLRRCRGAMFHLGIGGKNPLHSGKLRIPDEIIPLGVEMMTTLAVTALEGK